MIFGESIYLRAIEPDKDIEKCFYWVNDNIVTQFYNILSPISREYESNWLKKASKHKHKNAVYLSIVIKETDQFIGIASLSNIQPLHQIAKLGVMIGNRNFWNKGFELETIKLMCNYGFKHLNLNKIFVKILSINKDIIKIYEKANFKIEGKLRKHQFVNGEFCDLIYLGILRKEFEN